MHRRKPTPDITEDEIAALVDAYESMAPHDRMLARMYRECEVVEARSWELGLRALEPSAFDLYLKDIV